MRHCPECDRNVEPQRGFSWVGFIFGFGVFYLLYYFTKPKRCPICKIKL